MSETAIYLYGMTLITTSFRLAADFPQCDTYCEIAESHRLPGGETGTCAVVLAGLGLSVHLDGNFLGRNTYPELVSYFASSRISLDLMTYDPDFEGLEDMVFIDEQTRTAFGRFGEFFADKSLRRWNSANEEAIQSATVVGLDPFFFEESAEVARLCSKHEVKYATIDCRLDSAVHCLSEVNVLSEEFLRDNYPDQDFEALFSGYAERTQGLVIFTFGEKELWFGRNTQDVKKFTPYKVEVASTLGAGDSFKAGVIYGMSKCMDDATLVRFASATAAAACMNYPIARNPPTLKLISEIAGESFEDDIDIGMSLDK
jgi:sugar/nucleoside kinase (ribokinase family)